MRRKKAIVFAFILLTIVNAGIFLFREHFQYRPYVNEEALYQVCDDDCRNKWKQYIDDFSDAELAEAKKISDSVVQGEVSTFAKVKSLGNFIYSKFHTRMGKPTDEIRASSPLDQYKKFCSRDTLQLWCDNLSLMFSYFCWSQNIITRNIEILNPGDNHVVNECYIPETKSWILVDLTSNLIGVSGVGNTDSMLTLLSIRNAISTGSRLRSWRSVNDTMIQQEINPQKLSIYYNAGHKVLYYHWVNYFKVYGKRHKLKEYFLPVSWYDIYQDKEGSNILFYLKQLLIFLWLISVFVFLFTRTKFKS